MEQKKNEPKKENKLSESKNERQTLNKQKLNKRKDKYFFETRNSGSTVDQKVKINCEEQKTKSI